MNETLFPQALGDLEERKARDQDLFRAGIFRAGIYRGEWEAVRARVRGKQASLVLRRRMAALKLASQQITDKLGLEVEWPE